MKEFTQAALSFFSISGHPACVAVSERMSAVDLSIEPDGSGAKDNEPAACRYLAEAFSSSNAIELARMLADTNEHLNWREAPRDVIPSSMHGHHTYVEIIGPDVGFNSDEMRFGAFLMAPGISYPLHAHASEEVYIVVSGSGQWRSHNFPYESKQPGSIVHIPPWVPHAIRSGEEPLLMLWAHLGDIDFRKYRIEQSELNEDGNPH